MPLPSYYPSADLITSVTTYEYDDAHNRVARVRDGVTANYLYNNLNQMTQFSEGGRTVAYGYDLNGNRKTRTEGAVTDSYDYDYENRLVGTSKGGVGHAYTYDYRTRRVERMEGGTATRIVFSGGASVQEYMGANVQAEYVRGSDYGGGIGGLLYSLRAGVPSYTHYNNRGDVVAKTSTSGAVTWQAAYEAFGQRPAETGTTPDRQKASTKEEDPTGLLNEGFRYRDLETGEFITRDPLGFVDGPNLYTYVRQNPWTKFDPKGLEEAKKSEDKRPIDPVTKQRIVAPASDPAHPFKTAKEAAIAAAKIIAKQDTTNHEYGAAIIRKHDAWGKPTGGYTYGPIEEGPRRPGMSAMVLQNKSSEVKINPGSSPQNLAGTIHSHTPDAGEKPGENRDQSRQQALMKRQPETGAPSGAFSYRDGDIDKYNRDQYASDLGNAYPLHQEHYLMIPGKHIWVYKPQSPANSNEPYVIAPERFNYVGQLQ